MINIQEKMREVKKLKKELNEQFTKELLKECNLKKLPSYPLHLGKDVDIEGVLYTLHSKKVENILKHEVEFTLLLKDEFKYKGHVSRFSGSIFRKKSMGLVANITTATVELNLW